jgi:hypothetical protein
MWFVDKSDRMVNSYGIASRTCKWTKKLSFHLTDMTILNGILIHISHGGKMTHKNFREILVRELIINSQEENVTDTGISRGRPNQSASQLGIHIIGLPKENGGAACFRCTSKHGAHLCWKCDVGLCVVKCFDKWHMRVNLSH